MKAKARCRRLQRKVRVLQRQKRTLLAELFAMQARENRRAKREPASSERER